MEIELKYLVPNKEVMDSIYDDAYLFSVEEEGTRERLFFKASYFDTEDRALSENDIAFRVRMEGEKLVASLKWRGKVEGGLHQREEINIPLTDPNSYILPSPKIFKESEIGKEVIRLVGDKTLKCIMEMGFLRSSFKIDTGSSIIEVALDSGEIMTDKGNLPISELELELYSGNAKELLELGQKLALEYGLKTSDESKYHRGLKQLGIR